MAATISTDKTGALTEILGAGLVDGLAGLFEQMEWAEDEIEKAKRRHPDRADLIYHSFKLLTPTRDLMGTEFVYRSHCRELLERVAAGHDTRPGTAAEVCIACCDASMLAPLTETAAGLYARMWGVAFPGRRDQWAGTREHYEALRSSLIDDLEREAHHKLAQSDRRVTEIDCKGRHHGEPVDCTAAAILATGRKRKPAEVAEPEPAAGAAEELGVLFTMTGAAA